jgi:hypothetical protein
MSNNTLVHYGHTQTEELILVKELAKNLGLNFIHDGIQKISLRQPQYPIASYLDFVHHAKYANFVVIWNGMQCYGPLITQMCKNLGILRCYIEWGLLPQISNFLIDPMGFCGDSILNYDLSWIDSRDIENLYKKREELQKQYKICDEDYILVPLQLEDDSQVLYYTKYKNMYEFVSDIVKEYSDRKIIIKIHPKNNKDAYMKCWNKDYGSKFNSDKICFIDSTIPFLELASKASAIVGLTSTSLYEAAILGKPVISLGNHPLNNKKESIDTVCAGILALNIDRKQGHIKSVLDRFSISHYRF